MADKFSFRDLKGIFRNREVGTLGDGGGPEQGVEFYDKYGIYHDPSGRKEFLCVIMERDDPAANPNGPWTEDDYIPHSVARFDFKSQSWKTERGNMNLISSASFTFMDSEDAFLEELYKQVERRGHAHPSSVASAERPIEGEP